MDNKAIILMITILATAAAAFGAASDAQYAAHGFRAWSATPPEIDGIMNADEWRDADKFSAPVTGKNGGQLTLSLSVKNDDKKLYIGGSISGIEMPACKNQVLMYFDNDGDDKLEKGDNQWVVESSGANWDAFNPTGIPHHIATDTAGAAGGTHDIKTKMKYVNGNEGKGSYEFEFSGDLNSGDYKHDFSLKAGNKVNFAARFLDNDCEGESPDSSFIWPANTPEEGWSMIHIAPRQLTQ